MQRFLFLSTVFLASLFSEEDPEIFNYLAQGNQIVTSVRKLSFGNYPYACNPSLIKVEGGFLMTFRYTPDPYAQLWLSDIGIVFLNEELQPISEPQLLSTRQRFSKTPSQSEDARLFSYRGKTFLIFNDNVDQLWLTGGERRDMFMAELFYNEGRFTLSAPLKLIHESQHFHRFHEKNWVPFQWGQTLLFGYTIDPHEILYANLVDGQCYRCCKSEGDIDWAFGPLRGGTPAQLVDGEYLAFFHSSRPMVSPVSFGWNLWHYFAGAYTFSAEPPFEIKKMSPFPMIADHFYTESNYYKRVIFPGGFVALDDKIYLSYGKDDREIWIAILDKKALMDSLEIIPKRS